jgi:excisionase family DNA binding protein
MAMSRKYARLAEPPQELKESSHQPVANSKPRPIIRTRQTLSSAPVKKALSRTEELVLVGDRHQIFENLLDKKSLADFLGVSESLINKMIRQGTIPHFKVGKLVRFDRAEVSAFLKQRRKL